MTDLLEPTAIVGNASLFHADCRDVLRSLADNSIDSVVTDPPYALVSIVKRFGKPGSAPAKGNDAYMRASAGFMSKTWDTGEVAFSDEFWAEVLRVLKPGGHVVAFSGTRTYHRMAVAIEDAGFEIRDRIRFEQSFDTKYGPLLDSMNDEQRGALLELLNDYCDGGSELAWEYGSGFPKSHAADINLWNGVFACRSKDSAPLVVQISAFTHLKSNEGKEHIVAAPALIQPEGDPALIMATGKAGGSSEVTVMLLSESEAENISLSTGWSWDPSSAENCDPRSMFITETRSRLITTTEIWRSLTSSTTPKSTPHSVTLQNGWSWPAVNVGSISNDVKSSRSAIPILTVLDDATWNPVAQAKGGGTALKPAYEPICLARKPLTGTVAANLAEWGTGAINIDGCRVATDDGLNGGRYSDNKVGDDGSTYGAGINLRSANDYVQPAGRWPANICHDGSDEVMSCFPDAPGQMAKAAEGDDRRKDKNVYGSMTRGSNGAEPRIDTTKSAARFFYCAKASRKDRDEGLEAIGDKRANIHPTVKPTSLCQWLCRLVTPPGGIILDPFMGSGSTGKAALLEGFRFIGCEREDEYMPIAKARIAAALVPPEQRPVVAQAQPPANDNAPQLSLFSEAA